MQPLSSSSIRFYTEATNYSLKEKIKLRSWIITSINNENRFLGDISIIICNDKYLLSINKQYLKHDYYTDIITFNNSDDRNIISGDIFISIDRVRENAKIFSKTISNELHRVIIHGILHLIGFNDKSPQQKKIMTSKEDYYISLLR